MSVLSPRRASCPKRALPIKRGIPTCGSKWLAPSATINGVRGKILALANSNPPRLRGTAMHTIAAAMCVVGTGSANKVAMAMSRGGSMGRGIGHLTHGQVLPVRALFITDSLFMTEDLTAMGDIMAIRV